MAEGARAHCTNVLPQDGVGAPLLAPVPDEELSGVEEWDEEKLATKVTLPWIERLSADQVDAIFKRADTLGVDLGRREERLLAVVEVDDNRTIYKWFDSDVAYVAPPVAARERTSEVRRSANAALASDGAEAVPPHPKSSVVRSPRATRSAGGVPWIFQPKFIEPWDSFGDDTHEALDIFKSTLLRKEFGNPNLMSQDLAAESAHERETPVQTWALLFHKEVRARGLHPVIEHLSRDSVTLGCKYRMKGLVRLGFGLGERLVDGETYSVDDGSIVAFVECKRMATMPWISIINEYNACPQTPSKPLSPWMEMAVAPTPVEM